MPKLGLISRIALLVIFIQIAAFSLLGAFYVDRFSSSIEERTRKHLNLIGHMIANDELAVSSISNKEVMSDLIGEPYVQGMVIGGNGRVIVSTDPAHLGQQAINIVGFESKWLGENAQAEFVTGERSLTAVMQSRSGMSNAPIYTTVITIDTAELEATKRAISLVGFIGSILFILLSSAGIVWVAKRFISRRVDTSLAVMKRIEMGDLEARIPIVSKDGFGQLQQGVNSMTAKMADLLGQHLRSAEELKVKSQQLDSIVENIPNMIFMKHASDLKFALLNKAGEKLLGVGRNEVLGKSDYDFFPKEEADAFTKKDREVLASSAVFDIPEEELVSSDGTKHILHTQKLALHDAKGNPEFLLGISEEITERKKAENRILELAFYDQLTGLPNRTLLFDRLGQLLNSISRNHQFGALLFVDLDNFKMLNDTHGHDMGDLLLKRVSERMKKCVRSEDTVARVGGDEFLVMLTNLGSDEQEVAFKVEAIGRKILAELNQNYQLKDVAFHNSASIGATIIKNDSESVEEVLKQADLAMYRSKETGRNAFHFFNAAMQNVVMERVALEKDLRIAINEGQFLLYYQPQLGRRDLIVGAEVLIRWQHPQRGMVSPMEFITLAEETGLILPLGYWVLHTACKQQAIWATQPEMAHLTISVNVSAHQFRQADFVDQVLQIIESTGAQAHRLKLEITESMLVSNIEEIVMQMNTLREKGVSFSLDDFGTGYSSLSYLKRMPLDQLKIDQSFVRDIVTNTNNAAIAKTIVGLSESLGLSVIAEGVETEEQSNYLAKIGCYFYQGYFFSRPLPLEEFERFAHSTRNHDGVS